MGVYLYSGNPTSEGGKALAAALGIKRIRHTNSTYVPKVGDVVINWGAVKIPGFAPAKVINQDLTLSSDKLKFFQAMANVAIADRMVTPPFHETKEAAAAYLSVNGGSIVCRTILSGSGGKGIVIAKTPEELVDAKLYVQYVNKKDEYRVHIFDKKVIDIQKKARKHAVENPNWEIRNLEGGFIYKRQDVNAPACVVEVAQKCMEHLPLDFGAVDVIYNAFQNRAYVLEVNSAPGLEGKTVEIYAAAFKAFCGL